MLKSSNIILLLSSLPEAMVGPCVGVSKSGSVECRNTSSASGDPAAKWNSIGGVDGQCVDI